MLAVQGGVGPKGNEELRVVGVGSLVGHTQQKGLIVLQLEVLVLESRAVDGLAPCPIMVNEISSLSHEAFDDSMEDGALVAEAFGVRGKLSEVVGSFWDYLIEQLKLEPTDWFVCDGYIEIDVGLCFG